MSRTSAMRWAFTEDPLSPAVMLEMNSPSPCKVDASACSTPLYPLSSAQYYQQLHLPKAAALQQIPSPVKSQHSTPSPFSGNNEKISHSSRSPLASKKDTGIAKKGVKPKDGDHKLQGPMVELAADAHGSELLRQALRRATPEQGEAISRSLLAALPQLAMHEHGHTVIEEMLEASSSQNQRYIVTRLISRVPQLAANENGCRVVQKVLRTAPLDSQIQVAAALATADIIDTITNIHGNFVIQTCVEELPAYRLGFLLEPLQGRVKQVASDLCGCRVIQRLLEHCPINQLSDILEEMMANCLELVTDRFGCYVIRSVLDHGRESDKYRIICEVAGADIAANSRSRNFTLVIEKCLEVSAEDGQHAQSLAHARLLLAEALLRPPSLDAGASTDATSAEDVSSASSAVHAMSKCRHGRSLLRRFLASESEESEWQQLRQQITTVLEARSQS